MSYKYWLIVERYENWSQDRDNDFSVFGLPKRKLKLASKINKGDFLICYVSSGRSAFSDVRQVTNDTPIKTPKNVFYDEPFEHCIATEKKIVLPEQNWVSIRGLLTQLNLTKDRANWAPIMLNSLRELDQVDGELIKKEIEKAAKSSD